jgi:hypothetical protein
MQVRNEQTPLKILNNIEMLSTFPQNHRSVRCVSEIQLHIAAGLALLTRPSMDHRARIDLFSGFLFHEPARTVSL